VTSTSNVNSLPLIVPFSDLRKRSVVALTNVVAPTDRGSNAVISGAGIKGWCMDVKRLTGFSNM
jgi:hypothetical protein